MILQTILFNLGGYSHLDMSAYETYFTVKLTNHYLSEEELTANLNVLETSRISLYIRNICCLLIHLIEVRGCHSRMLPTLDVWVQV